MDGDSDVGGCEPISVVMVGAGGGDALVHETMGTVHTARQTNTAHSTRPSMGTPWWPRVIPKAYDGMGRLRAILAGPTSVAARRIHRPPAGVTREFALTVAGTRGRL